MNLEHKGRLLLDTIELLEKYLDTNGILLDGNDIYSELLEIKQSLNSIYY